VAVAEAVLFASAAVHKVVMVASGTAVGEPLTAKRPLTARHPEAALLAAGAGEAALVAALVRRPRAGLAAATAVLLLYARELRGVEQDAPCHCFAVTTTATARTATVRDVALAGVSATALLASRERPAASAPLGAGLVAGALLAAIAAGEQLAR
jgi:hypothetical protein